MSREAASLECKEGDCTSKHQALGVTQTNSNLLRCAATADDISKAHLLSHLEALHVRLEEVGKSGDTTVGVGDGPGRSNPCAG